MFALIDGNSFYCSCERVFRPELRNVPIAVLSNNDGCVIARTPEVKAMGIKMGTPYFQVKHLVSRGELVVFSSNYELYADLSRRMMGTIAGCVPRVEVYSIDECFADMSGLSDLRRRGIEIRSRVLQWVGIPTCVGIAPTKTLAKFCNHLAKRHRNHFDGVVVWNDWSGEVRERALVSEPVTEIWGIGRRIGKKLAAQGIETALDFVNAHTPTLRAQFGVVVERTQKEMQGIICDELHTETDTRKNLIRSRSFGQTVNDIESLRSAISSHISSGAATLREQGTKAHIVGVFVHTNPFRDDLEQYYGNKTIALPQASSDTIVLNNIAQRLLEMTYREGYEYKKCGIQLGGIEPAAEYHQSDLWTDKGSERRERLMTAWDNVVSRFGRKKIRLGSEMLSGKWVMTRNELSPCFTTKWTELPVVD